LDGTLATTNDCIKQELPEVSISLYGHGSWELHQVQARSPEILELTLWSWKHH